MTRSVDFLVIGHGLAGAFVAWFLEKAGCSMLIIDDCDPSGASSVSAGLFNPLMPRKLALSRGADLQIPFLKLVIGEMESELGSRYLHPTEILYVFADDNERRTWIQAAREARPGFPAFFDPAVIEPGGLLETGIRAEHGAGRVVGAGYVDAAALLADRRASLEGRGLLVRRRVEPTDLTYDTAGARWASGGVAAGGVIFCEGFAVRLNPFFRALPIVPVKGEILTARARDAGTPVALTSGDGRSDVAAPPVGPSNAESPGAGASNAESSVVDERRIITNREYIVPTGGNTVRIGSTWHQDVADRTATAEARRRLLSAAARLVTWRFEVVEHLAGVRPRVRDGHPVVGTHPDRPNIAILNGLGSRGVMLAPYWAQRLVGSLVADDTIPFEASVRRFEERFR